MNTLSEYKIYYNEDARYDIRNRKYMETIKKMYPKSVKNRQCLGPCYQPNTRTIHPLTLDDKIFGNTAICHTERYLNTSKKRFGDDKWYNWDVCKNPTAKQTTDELGLGVLPYMVFNEKLFLENSYGLSSFDETLQWLTDNNELPYRTKERVFDNGLTLYGKYINTIDDRLIKHVISIFIYHLPIIYRNIRKFIIITPTDIKLREPSINAIPSDTHDNIKMIRSYIKKIFLNEREIYDFINKVLKTRKKEITKNFPSNTLTKLMIQYIIKRIYLTIQNNK